MLSKLKMDGCLYHDDVVDYAIKKGAEDLLWENADGNLVLRGELLSAFRRLTDGTVVWVKPDRYWRYRVLEDEAGREARG